MPANSLTDCSFQRSPQVYSNTIGLLVGVFTTLMCCETPRRSIYAFWTGQLSGIDGHGRTAARLPRPRSGHRFWKRRIVDANRRTALGVERARAERVWKALLQAGLVSFSEAVVGQSPAMEFAEAHVVPMEPEWQKGHWFPQGDWMSPACFSLSFALRVQLCRFQFGDFLNTTGISSVAVVAVSTGMQRLS